MIKFIEVRLEENGRRRCIPISEIKYIDGYSDDQGERLTLIHLKGEVVEPVKCTNSYTSVKTALDDMQSDSTTSVIYYVD